jgi:hypothetical protein
MTRHRPSQTSAAASMPRPTAPLVPDGVNDRPTVSFGRNSGIASRCASPQCRNDRALQTSRGGARTFLDIGQKANFP